MKILQIRFLVVVLFLCSSAVLSAQITKKSYKQEGDECFTRGEYERAVRLYNLAKEIENADISDKLKAAESCKAFFTQGDDFFFAENYAKAKICYQFILDANPADENAKKRLAACEKVLKTQEQEKDYIELKAGKIAVQKNDISGAPVSWESAVTLCKNSIVGGYTNWRLPSSDELAMVYSNKEIIGNFKKVDYWSITPYASNASFSYVIHFMSGQKDYFLKTSSYNCRCVRTLP